MMLIIKMIQNIISLVDTISIKNVSLKHFSIPCKSNAQYAENWAFLTDYILNIKQENKMKLKWLINSNKLYKCK